MKYSSREFSSVSWIWPLWCPAPALQETVPVPQETAAGEPPIIGMIWKPMGKHGGWLSMINGQKLGGLNSRSVLFPSSRLRSWKEIMDYEATAGQGQLYLKAVGEGPAWTGPAPLPLHSQTGHSSLCLHLPVCVISSSCKDPSH